MQSSNLERPADGRTLCVCLVIMLLACCFPVATRGEEARLFGQRITEQLVETETEYGITLSGLTAFKRIQKAARLRPVYQAMVNAEKERIALRRQISADPASSRRIEMATYRDRDGEGDGVVTLLRPKKIVVNKPTTSTANDEGAESFEPLVVTRPPSRLLSKVKQDERPTQDSVTKAAKLRDVIVEPIGNEPETKNQVTMTPKPDSKSASKSTKRAASLAPGLTPTTTEAVDEQEPQSIEAVVESAPHVTSKAIKREPAAKKKVKATLVSDRLADHIRSLGPTTSVDQATKPRVAEAAETQELSLSAAETVGASRVEEQDFVEKLPVQAAPVATLAVATPPSLSIGSPIAPQATNRGTTTRPHAIVSPTRPTVPVDLAAETPTPNSRQSSVPAIPGLAATELNEPAQIASPSQSPTIPLAINPRVAIPGSTAPRMAPDARVAQWPFNLGNSVAQPTATQVANNEVTLNVDDVDVRTVFELLHKGYGLNIIVAPGVTGTVTANVAGLSPEQALRSVVKMCNLATQTDGDVTLVYPADSLPRDARQLRVFPLDFARAEVIEATIQGILSPVGSAYTSSVDELDNRKARESVVVIDIPEVLEQVDYYIAQIDQPPRQVLIEARVLEIELRDNYEHGINFEQLFGGDLRVGAIQLGDNLATSTNPVFFADINGSELDAVLTMLETTTDAKTLATPQVMVINGQHAKIQVGQQLGFAVATVTQTSTVSGRSLPGHRCRTRGYPDDRPRRSNFDASQTQGQHRRDQSGDTLLPEETTREVDTPP